MRYFAPIITTFALHLSALTDDLPEAVMASDTTDQGAVAVAPDTGVSGEFGTWTVTYRAGENGISEGGGIRVQLPDAWHAGPRNSANRLQATDPAGDHYVNAHTFANGVTIKTIVEDEVDHTLVKHGKNSLDGRSERYVFVVRVVIEDGALESGDEIQVVYGDTSGGSRGYRAGAVSTPALPVLLAVDETGGGEFRLHTQRPRITIRPGQPIELQMHAPSNAMLGEPMRILVSMLDKEDNPAHAADEVAISVVEGEAETPGQVIIPIRTGYTAFEVTPQSEGILRLEATSDQWVLSAQSNPVAVAEEVPAQRIFWGDLHSHSHFSWDGVGYHNFDHARYIAGLDFYAMTDHSRTPRNGRHRGLDAATWDDYTALTERRHDPPHFVTLHAYECSFGRPYGHHNVFFRGDPGPLAAPESHELPELWDLLTAGDALTIPHHTGKFPRGVDFRIHDSAFRRNFEIYSAHGLSEAFDPLHPLAFEHSTFTSPSQSADHPSHAQDAWRMGLRLSTVAASDDHRAHPGLPHWGLTAVVAPELSRNAVFQALYDRRTYGTTGAKILLNFQINGEPMGGTVQVSESPEVTIRAVGTDTISRVELLRLSGGDEGGWDIIQTWNPDALEFATTYRDTAFDAPAIYYVRLRQARPVRDRIAMAWSSPIWAVE